MKRNQLILGLFFLFQIFFSPLNAAHIIGGEVMYKCLGNNVYEFTMKIYRDCNGGGALFDSSPGSPIAASVTIYEGNSTTPFISVPNNIASSIYLNAPIVQLLDVVYPSPCLTSLPVCVEEGTYHFILTLPSSPESYHIVYQRCCRNNTISNIINPGETGATFYLELKPEAQFANGNCQNNTPEFTNFPPLVICAQEPINFDHSAIDTDGDELLYKFCGPLKGGGTGGTNGSGLPTDIDGVTPEPDAPPVYSNVDFILPTYSGMNPLAGNPQIVIDPTTGIITGTPEVTGQFVVGVCVDEMRNGNVISRVQRDFQFNIKNCMPQVISSDFNFDLISNNVNFSNESVNAHTYTWDFGDQNTSVEESPNHSYTSTGTYMVTLNSYNDFCQLVDSETKEITIMTTAIEETKGALKISVTPNPSDGQFYIEVNDLITKELQIELFDVNGEKVLDVLDENIVGDYVKSFDQSYLPKGIYFLKLSSETNVQVERVMIQ